MPRPVTLALVVIALIGSAAGPRADAPRAAPWTLDDPVSKHIPELVGRKK